MYNYIDSNGIMAAIFFPLLVIIGSFFLLNLFLAVIMETFSETSKLERDKERTNYNFKDSADKQMLKNNSSLTKMMEINKLKVSYQGGARNLGEAAMIALEHQKQE